jgi:hypothetical protein
MYYTMSRRDPPAGYRSPHSTSPPVQNIKRDPFQQAVGVDQKRQLAWEVRSVAMTAFNTAGHAAFGQRLWESIFCRTSIRRCGERAGLSQVLGRSKSTAVMQATRARFTFPNGSLRASIRNDIA